MSTFGISGTFGVAVAHHELILWENDAMRSTNLLKLVLDLKMILLYIKIPIVTLEIIYYIGLNFKCIIVKSNIS